MRSGCRKPKGLEIERKSFVFLHSSAFLKMSLYVLTLVLAASFLHAYWNYLAKKANGKLPFVWLVYVTCSVLYLPVLVYQTAMSKISYSNTLAFFALLSAVVHLIYFVVLQTGYRKADLSVVYPLARGSGPLLSSLAAVFLLGERYSFPIALGLALIVGGVLVITKLRLTLSGNERLKKGLAYGIATGGLIAAYTVVDNVAVKTYNLSPLVITSASNVFGSVVLLPLALRNKEEIRREIREHKWIILAISVLSPVAYVLILMALKQAALVVVAPARETGILFGVFMGAKLMNEADAKRRTVGALLILAGIIFLSVAKS